MRYQRSLAIAGRLELLLELIRSGAYSTPALAEKLGVCEQTVYRDILFLKHQGYHLRSRKFAGGWAYELLEESGDAGQEASGT
jgi:DeoR/GlpR family transcriptional regulator of sugar metabolism